MQKIYFRTSNLQKVPCATWGDFLASFYVFVYNSYSQVPLLAVLDRQPSWRKRQYHKLIQCMEAAIRSHRIKSTFYRGMTWLYTASPNTGSTMKNYADFLEQVESGVVTFNRFYSGSFDIHVALGYMDNLPTILTDIKRIGMVPLDLPAAPLHYKTALIEFEGHCTPVESIGHTGKSNNECIIDPMDQWIVQKVELDRDVHIGINTCDWLEIKLIRKE